MNITIIPRNKHCYHLAICLLCLAATLTLLLFLVPLPMGTGAGNVSLASYENITNDVVRLHILADNDAKEAQMVKLSVRDAILPSIHELTGSAATKEEALSLLKSNLDFLNAVANDALQALETPYSAHVSVDTGYFPLRIYGSQTFLSKDAILFPPAVYDTVTITLGSGEGHNWWCLAYPSLCFIDASYDYIPKESIEYQSVFAKLDNKRLRSLFYSGFSSAPDIFTSYDFKNTTTDSDVDDTTDVVLRSKLWELLKHWMNSSDSH